MITLYGFDKAIVGTASACTADGHVHRAIYDGSKIIEILMDNSRMSHEEAEEYISYKLAGSGLGILVRAVCTYTYPVLPLKCTESVHVQSRY